MAPGAIALPIYPGSKDGDETPETLGNDDDERLANELDDYATGDDVEGKSLLASPSSRPAGTKSKRTARSRRRTNGADKEAAATAARSSLACAGIFVIASALLFIVFPAFLPQTTHHHTGMTPQHDVRFSNGTHQFRKTVLMVSIDGLRADYLDRGLTPHLLNISRQGIRAKSMKPIFPTLTFPNYWSILTGLYAESHGVVANDFYDPVTNSYFHYHNTTIVRESSWWGGEPIWETASKAGLITANLMWLGPCQTASGIKPTYFVPWRDKVPLQEKHDQIMSWIDMPFETRPQLILAYEPHLDQVGHQAGPYSDLVNSVLVDVDNFAKSIHTSLRQRNLSNIVDVIFVSDHGMTNTSNTRLVYLDDVMGKEHVNQIEHQEGWPSVGLRMSKEANISDVLSRLLSSPPATSSPPAINVYTAETMPGRFHFNPLNNQRIAPIYIVPRIGWALTNHHEHEVISYQLKGNHGYDNAEFSMHAIFVANGPFATLLKKRGNSALQRMSLRGMRIQSSIFAMRPLRPLRRIIRNLTGSRLSELGSDGVVAESRKEPQIIEQFDNVEVYGLIVKLLNLDKFAAPNNGTPGFWNRYLDGDAGER